MNQRYFFLLSYKGTNYCGWQRQPNSPSIQQEIEDAISKLFSNQKIQVVGCGRTDTGVHASEYFLHTDLPNKYRTEDLIFKLNGILSLDIAIHRIFPVENNYHARFDATSRTYKYFIHQEKSPFKNDESLYVHAHLDIEAMNDAAKYLIGKQDFTSFSKLHTDVKTNICEVFKAEWVIVDNNSFYFEISANRFLRNMVRAIVGTLLDVGLGKLKPFEVQDVILKKDRNVAGTSVPAHGLFLSKVVYPFIDKI